MEIFEKFWFWLHHMPSLLLIGLLTLIGFYCGRGMQRYLKLPSILSYMLLGVLLGPSGVNILADHLQSSFSFIVEMTLGFIALHIGLELNLKSLNHSGRGIAWLIFAETFGAAFAVTIAIYLASGNLPLALIFGAIAPASAPAGTVAVIREYQAKGPLTKVLYAIVGFDDGLTILIFGFCSALAKNLIINEKHISMWFLIENSIKEISLVLVVGLLISAIFIFCIRPLNRPRNMLILTFCFVTITVGLSELLHVSIILTCMLLGFVISNTQGKEVVERIELRLNFLMPLLFILFFSLAGSSLHLNRLSNLGLIGIVYILSRIFGLMGGAWLGAVMGKMSSTIRRYSGMGILSQAGVAIGLSLVVKQDFHGLGLEISNAKGVIEPLGDYIGAVVLTTVTASSVFFELLGPILTRIALKKAGETAVIPVEIVPETFSS